MRARNKASDTLRIRCFASGKGIRVRAAGGGGGRQQLAPGEMQSGRQNGWRAIAKWCYLSGERRPLDAVRASHNPLLPPGMGIFPATSDARRRCTQMQIVPVFRIGNPLFWTTKTQHNYLSKVKRIFLGVSGSF
jgi:hypothetical protein